MLPEATPASRSVLQSRASIGQPPKRKHESCNYVRQPHRAPNERPRTDHEQQQGTGHERQHNCNSVQPRAVAKGIVTRCTPVPIEHPSVERKGSRKIGPACYETRKKLRALHRSPAIELPEESARKRKISTAIQRGARREINRPSAALLCFEQPNFPRRRKRRRRRV